MGKQQKLHKREWENQGEEDDDEDDIEQKQDEEEEVDEGEEEDDDDQDEDDEDEDDEEFDSKEIEQRKGGDDDEDDSDEDDEDDEDDLIDITKKKCDISEEDDDEDDDDEDDDEDDDDSVLNVEMQFKDANETMFHSVKSLVNSYLDGKDYSSSDLADIIVKQCLLGTFIVIEEEEEEQAKKIREKAKLEKETNCIGFCTLLNSKRQEPVIADILKYVTEKSETFNSADDHNKFLEILQSKKVGLLINERIINVAPQAVPVLHTQIKEDHTWVKEKHPQQFKDSFDFEYLLCLTRCAKEKSHNPDQQLGHKKVKKSEDDLEDYLYPKYEDFCLLEKACWKFFFEAQVSSQSGLSKQNLDQVKTKQIPYKAIYLVKLADYFKTIPEMTEQLTEE